MIRRLIAVALGFALNVHAGTTQNVLMSASAAKEPTVVCRMDDTNGREITSEVPSGAVDQIMAHGGHRGPCFTYGDTTSIGAGKVRTYAQIHRDGSPAALGIEFSEATLADLPHEDADGTTCWDTDNDGVLTDGECAGGHQRVLFFPPLKNTPFKWFLLNWDPHGHPPQGIYSVPHFDFHFYTLEYLARNYIRPGPCGMVVNCEDFKKGMTPVPGQYIHYDYKSVGAVAGREGNHLIDFSSPEFGPGGQNDFTHTFIFGAYEGRLAFWEPMITMAYFRQKPNSCTPIKLPTAYQEAGYYPMHYCIRYREARKSYTVSLEGFRYRPAH